MGDNVSKINGESPKKNPPELTEHEAETLVYEAFRRSGALLPQTLEEVEAAEAEMDEERIELPLSLRDPMAILDKRAKAVAEGNYEPEVTT